MNLAKFTVDTKLFRELGDMLVGRESTAIVELVKNSYDADATVVLLEAHSLKNPESGTIQIADNGVGMTQEEFEKGFLTIASRSKTIGDRRSAVFGRRFTGEKGIGRLALHKLATHSQIRSIRWHPGKPSTAGLPTKGTGVEASIDWDKIEKLDTIDDIENSGALAVKKLEDRKADTAGTEFNLSRLRRGWTKRMLHRFYEDVATLVPPKVLVDELPTTAVDGPLLFRNPTICDQTNDARGSFEVAYAGEFQAPEQLLPNAAERAGWIVELNCDAENGIFECAVLPTRKYREEWPAATPFRVTLDLAEEERAASFQARILSAEDGSWSEAFRGVRVYMEGFRVQPYGDRSDDWLNLDLDYRRRGRALMPSLGRKFDDWIAGEEGEFLTARGNEVYFGGVFLTQNRSADLEMLVNREGFLPGSTFEILRDKVRLGIDFLVRVRYASTKEVKQTRKKYRNRQKRATRTADVRELPTVLIVKERISSATEAIRDVQSNLASGDMGNAGSALKNADEPLTELRELIQDFSDEAKLFRINASIGTEMAAFVHEINNLVGFAITITEALDSLRSERKLTREQARWLKTAHEAAIDLRHAVERQSVYLKDITSASVRRRRSRQSLRGRFKSACRLVEGASERRRIRILNEIPENVRTLPMFPAEVTALFSNLLTNAVKAAGDEGAIRATAWEDTEQDTVVCTIENTGVSVDITHGDIWFEPFRSTSTNVDADVGQGMGLGLTIARSTVQEYGGVMRFVEPTEGYSTGIEFRLPR